MALPGDYPKMTKVSDQVLPPDTQEIDRRKSLEKIGRVNLKAVGDVLSRYGMDPAEELAKILAKRKPVLDGKGNQVFDPETKEPLTEPVLATDLLLRTHLELLRYTRPQLKAVEVTMKEPELTEEQVKARIKALVARGAASSEQT